MGKWLAWAGVSLLAYSVAGALPATGEVAEQVLRGSVAFSSGAALMTMLFTEMLR